MEGCKNIFTRFLVSSDILSNRNKCTYFKREGNVNPAICTCYQLKILIIKDRLHICGSKGGRQGRAPPWGSKFFHFHAVFSPKLKNNSDFGSWRTPLGKILDPPLLQLVKTKALKSVRRVIINTRKTIPTFT